MNGNLFENPAGAVGEWLTAHCDGGSRGNPGPSGYGAVIEDAHGHVLAQLSEFLGVQTNNYAEYSGLLAVLKWANENGTKYLRVVSDSELMVKQMQGKYKVASPILRPLWEEAKRRSKRIERFEMRHTLRGGNKAADRLANEAMDKGMGKAVSGASGVGVPASQAVSKPKANRPSPQPTAKPARQILEGYVKGGVVHPLEGELPDGIFVKIVRE
jgi:probable phosphoglycerate mutase